MLFNSFSFLVFLPIVFALYWLAGPGRLRMQNILLLLASYFFYACWDWRFLFLLLFSTLLDYYTGLKMEMTVQPNRRRLWFWLSVVINLGFLGVFKYYNFFADSFAESLARLGVQVHLTSLQVILPVGISFYTFHGLSYVIDIYKGRIRAERQFVDYALFVSFFPLLVAGPIERATHLLPQIKQHRSFDYARAVDGLRQILWGFFKKMVIADNCAYFANQVFDHAADHQGSTLVLGALFFTFQIYGDFSGYSDIALGTARLFGINLLRNFAYPYFSRDIAEFWRRWHISLSSWFRDYVYIPLGGSKGSRWRQVRNIFIIFILSGFWHGANWTFVFWGLLNALYFLPLLLTRQNRTHLEIVAQGRLLPTAREAVQMMVTFGIAVFAWIFFRAASLGDAVHYLLGMCSRSLFSVPNFYAMQKALVTLLLVAVCMVMEWLGREDQFAIQQFPTRWKRPWRHALYYTLVSIIILFSGSEQTFIYFQF